jgi:hypothetical protein
MLFLGVPIRAIHLREGNTVLTAQAVRAVLVVERIFPVDRGNAVAGSPEIPLYPSLRVNWF